MRPAAYPADLNAWYCPGAFDLASGTWQDCSGNGNTATLSGSGLAELRGAGHGATSEVLALSGTTSSVTAFGPVIKSEFTVCSVTRYRTPGGAKNRILNGKGANWAHGHRYSKAGVAYYQGWKTAVQNNVSPMTDWVVMCGTNAGSQLKLANGVDVGTATGGTGNVSLFVNDGSYGSPSNFAIAEVVVWSRGLSFGVSAVVVESGHLEMSNCTVRGVQGARAINASGGGATIRSSLFKANLAGAIAATSGSHVRPWAAVRAWARCRRRERGRR